MAFFYEQHILAIYIVDNIYTEYDATSNIIFTRAGVMS